MKNTPPFKSKLIPHQKEIFRMWWSRKTLKEIKAYLETQDVQISLQGISLFIKRRNKRPDPRYIPEHLKYLLEDKIAKKEYIKLTPAFSITGDLQLKNNTVI